MEAFHSLKKVHSTFTLFGRKWENKKQTYFGVTTENCFSGKKNISAFSLIFDVASLLRKHEKEMDCNNSSLICFRFSKISSNFFTALNTPAFKNYLKTHGQGIIYLNI